MYCVCVLLSAKFAFMCVLFPYASVRLFVCMSNFDDYDAVGMVVTQREHYIGGVRSVYLLSIFSSFCLLIS